jgi:hypothetical protein
MWRTILIDSDAAEFVREFLKGCHPGHRSAFRWVRKDYDPDGSYLSGTLEMLNIASAAEAGYCAALQDAAIKARK